jgi:hypothetical protein
MYNEIQRIKQGVDETNITYLNINIKGNPNNGEDEGYAIFNENRSVPILDNPSQWIVGMVRFYVPAYYIPIFKWATQEPLPLEDPSLTVYFKFNGVVVSKNVDFIPYTNNIKEERIIWNYTNFLTMVNYTIFECLNLAMLIPDFPFNLRTPRLILDSTTNLISLYSDINMILGSGIELSFSKLLYSYFPSFVVKEDVLSVLGKSIYVFQVFDNVINFIEDYDGVMGYKMLQEFPTLSLWSNIDRILFISNMIPVDTELDGGQLNIQSRVIFDFILENSQLNDRTAIIYNSSGNQRWYDLLSSYPLKKTDLEIRLLFKDGTSAPLKLLSTDTLTCKLQFVKKGTMTNLN